MKRIGALFLTLAAMSFGGLPAMAEMSSLPTIDLQVRCKTSEKAIVSMMGNQSLRQQAFDTCMSSEQAARDAMIKSWPEMPQSYKAFCIRPKDYSPSYIEWIACVEMMIDIRKLREPMDTQAEVSKLCPVIRYDADGSIRSIKACSL